jgi:hypothetical protein
VSKEQGPVNGSRAVVDVLAGNHAHFEEQLWASFEKRAKKQLQATGGACRRTGRACIALGNRQTYAIGIDDPAMVSEGSAGSEGDNNDETL